MKARLLRPSTVVTLLTVAASLSGSILSAASTRTVRRGSAIRTKAAATSNYSVEVPVVTRVVGTALFRTAIDISNNTESGTTAVPVVARLQYSYNRVNSDGSLSFFHTPDPTSASGQALKINLLAFDNFHTDDIVQYLASLNVLEPGAAESSFGTLLVTFDGFPCGSTCAGWQGTATARTYSPNPTGAGTVAIAYPASLFFESASQTLVATIRDTQTSPSDAGTLRTNIGIRNTDVNNTARNVTVQVSFYDVTAGSSTNGQRVGAILSLTLQPGEVQQLNNVRALAAIPNNVTAMLAFADVLGQAGPTIEGYVNILDGGTQDGAYFEMKCTDTDGCDN
jgi:hypothetical protein